MMVNLGDVASINPRLSDPLQQTELVSFVPMASLSAEEARVVSTETRAYSEVSKGYTPFRNGDVLVAKITPCFENGKIAQAHLPHPNGFGSTEFHVIRPKESLLDGRYLHHLLRQADIRVEGERRMTGSGGQRRVPATFLSSLRIPLPRLEEQRRVAAILDQADALRAKRRKALALLDELQRGIFIEMFGDPVTSPKGCTAGTLGDGIEEMQYGPRFHNEAYSPEGIRIVRITDLDAAGSLDFDSMPRMEVDEETRDKFALRAGDVVFARTGATVGKVALIKERDPVCIAGAYFIRMRFQSRILPEYAFSVLQSESVQSLIFAQSRQAAQQNFSGPGLRRLPMPVPSIERQRRFAERVEAVGSEKSKQLSALALLDELFSSLQHRAFRGEL
ncbi:restriction modification system DNA specificity domain protein [Thauera aminoaromatica]|uniref:Restriction modification system DNA specificity domain protein n=2 Tax=Thauera aminoaromatica TaxID=164330 RepID=C4KBJ9_THASP|nr:restriction modification system DNA specificity domain protein [Thauera aminoaromatica]